MVTVAYNFNSNVIMGILTKEEVILVLKPVDKLFDLLVFRDVGLVRRYNLAHSAIIP
jgi:hypothetical protein